MRKVCVVLSVFTIIFSAGICLASPLTDFSQGKASLDVAWRPNMDMKVSSIAVDGKKGNFEGGLTFGLGENWAFQVKYGAPQSKDATFKIKHEVAEYNVLYSIDKNFAAFVGYANARITFNDLPSERKNVAQIGIQAVAPIGDKASFYAVAGFGKDLSQWEVGLSYALDPSVDFNVAYKESLIKNARPYPMPSADWKAKGTSIGFSFKI